MVKNLFGSKSMMLLVIGLLAIAMASKIPLPTCNAPKLALSSLPITLDETQTYNMNDIFSGYNLKLTIPV
jgi:hypothetical protein